MQYNYHCNRVVILTLWTCTILVIFSCFRNTTDAIASNIKKIHNIYLYNRQYLLYIIIWGIVFPEDFNQKLFLFVDFYLSSDKLARKIYLSGRFYVQVRRVGHGNSTPMILDSIHIIRLPLRWACYSRTKLRNWPLNTRTMMASFDTNDFMTYVLVYVNLLIKDVIIIISVSINNDGMR